MAKTITTSIQINARPEKVWGILSDFENYSFWNPFIVLINGHLKQGERLTVQLKGMTFKPTVVEIKENKKLSWLGHFIIPKLFDGKHSFELIEQTNTTTTFIHKEEFSGFLTHFLGKTFFSNLEENFKSMNKSLKQKAEIA